MRTGMKLGWTAIALLVGMVSMARAIEVKPKALAHEMEGAKAYKLGEFRRAIDEFKAAYEISPAPIYLFNMGQAERKLGDYEHALFHYQQYLADAPNGQFHLVAQDHVKTLQNLLREMKNVTSAPPPSTARSDQDRPEAAAAPPSRTSTPASGSTPAAVPSPGTSTASPPASGSSTPVPPMAPLAPTSSASAKASPPLPPAAMSADVPSSPAPSRPASRRWLWVAVGVAAAVAVGAAVGIGIAATQQSEPPGTDVGRVGVLP